MDLAKIQHMRGGQSKIILIYVMEKVGFFFFDISRLSGNDNNIKYNDSLELIVVTRINKVSLV